MADQRPLPTQRSATMAELARTQAILQRTFALGKLPVAQEIKMRADVAELLMQTSTSLSHPQYLYDAIDHLETILRRVPQGGADRQKYLNRLSFAKMSEYMVSGSQRALDRAVLYGQQAKEAANASPDTNIRSSESYWEILQNLSFALSQRYALLQDPDDLEGSISCSKETYDLARKSSEMYQLNLNNLASRLRLRYLRSGNSDDVNRAISLLCELMSLTSPGTAQHSTAVGQLGVLTADNFNRTGRLQDLDEALQQCKTGLEGLPQGHETRIAMLRQIVQLHTTRHDKTNDTSDLEDTIRYSYLLFEAVPSGHTDKGRYLLDYLASLQRRAFAVDSDSSVETTIQQAQAMLSAMTAEFPARRECQEIVATLLGKQYLVSNNLQHLLALVEYTRNIYTEYNDNVRKAGSTNPSVETKWLYDLRANLRQLESSPRENNLRKLAEKNLYTSFRSCYDDPNSIFQALAQVHIRDDLCLQVVAEAIKAGRTLSEDDITAEAAKLKDANAAALLERQSRPRYRPPEYQTELGLRQLAHDPESGDLSWISVVSWRGYWAMTEVSQSPERNSLAEKDA